MAPFLNERLPRSLLPIPFLLKFYAKRRSLIFVLVPSLALEVACEVACAFSYSSRARPFVLEDACRLAKTCLLFSRFPNLLVLNLLTEVKLTKYWSSTHCRKIQELNPLLV